RRHVRARAVDARGLPDPFVEVARAYGKRVAIEEGRDSDRRLAAVRKAVEPHPLPVDEGKTLQPIECLLVLAGDEGKQRQLERVRQALDHAEAIATGMGVLRRIGG